MKTKLKALTFLLLLALAALSQTPVLAYYDPGVQRWINRDPVAEFGDRNLFTFCENKPLGYFDPTGYKGISLPRVPERIPPTIRHPKDNSPEVELSPGWFNMACCINNARKELKKDLQQSEDALADCTDACGTREQCIIDCRTTAIWSLEHASIKYLVAAFSCMVPGMSEGQDVFPLK